MPVRLLTEHEVARLKKLCEIHSYRVAAEIVGCGQATVYRLAKRNWAHFSPRKNARQKPSDFNLLASTMTVVELQKHYRTSQDYIRRWLEGVERNYKPKAVKRAFPVPSDFVKLWPTMQAKQLATHYGVSKETVTRWRDVCGLPSKWPEKRVRNLEAKKAPKIGWVERYVEQHRRAA